MERKFYSFNSPGSVRQHIEQVKVVGDVLQLDYDIEKSECNLVKFNYGASGIWAVDYAQKGVGAFYRHIFITEPGLKTFTPLVPHDCDSFSIVKS